MKKLICMLAAVMLLFTACGNRDANDGTNNGVVQDGDGIIEDDRNNSVADDMADGANDVVDGATDAVDDAANGVENAVDDMTDNNKTDKNKNNK